ncbi:TMEM165/GDT1 family protein [Ilumatobacter sp.]|uniref:TMEM165/GDT1 family protein n=1 Tax=Ilumatobacter sp. TaxID=1967498 RepID=UPI003AF57F3A
MSSFWSALVVVFVAELGDKTQLVALGFGARHRLRWVLTGIGLAYVATNLMSVVIGALVGAALPGRVVRVAGGILFLAFAVWTMREPDGTGPGPEKQGDDRVPVPRRPARVVMSVAGAMFVAELGDKTMLATATLASTRNPVLVWAGATLGIFLAGALGATVGRAIGDRVPERSVRIGAAALFAAFGIALIVSTID